jgi:hypothetical protein
MIDAWSRKRWRATALGACLLAALLATWPLALHLASAVPLGTETAATIPIFDGLAAGPSNDPQPSDLAPLLTPVYADSDVATFRLTPPPGACPPMRLDVGTP